MTHFHLKYLYQKYSKNLLSNNMSEIYDIKDIIEILDNNGIEINHNKKVYPISMIIYVKS